MNRRFVLKLLAPLMLVLGVVGCTVVGRQQQPPPPQTQLQTRQPQTREYDTNDVKLVMKAVLNTLQDDGFTIKNAVVDLGLISATKEIDLGRTSRGSTSGNDDFWASLFRAAAGVDRKPQPQQEIRYEKLKQIEATLNISEFGKRTRVRASFQAKILDDKGNPMEIYPVDDLKFYQDFFMKVDKGIFIEKQKF